MEPERSVEKHRSSSFLLSPVININFTELYDAWHTEVRTIECEIKLYIFQRKIGN